MDVFFWYVHLFDIFAWFSVRLHHLHIENMYLMLEKIITISNQLFSILCRFIARDKISQKFYSKKIDKNLWYFIEKYFYWNALNIQPSEMWRLTIDYNYENLLIGFGNGIAWIGNFLKLLKSQVTLHYLDYFNILPYVLLWNNL